MRKSIGTKNIGQKLSHPIPTNVALSWKTKNKNN